MPYVPYETDTLGFAAHDATPDGVLPAPAIAGGPGFRCDLCNLTLNSENQLHQHYQGRQHLKAEQLQKKAQSAGYAHSAHGGSPSMSPSPKMGKRKRVPPAGHHNFARNSRQRSHDYCPVPISPLPYGAAPQKPQTVVAPGGTTAYPPIPSRVHSQAAVYAPAATPTPPGYYPPTPYTQLPPISSSPSSFSSPPPIYYYGYGQTYAPYGGDGGYNPTAPSIYGPQYSHCTSHQTYLPYSMGVSPYGADAAGGQPYPGYENMQWS